MTGTWGWVLLAGIVVGLLVFDLAMFGRRSERITAKVALFWSVVWAAIGLLFTVHVWWTGGRGAAEEYLAGFVIEKSLSIDNLFVFAMIFSYFAIPFELQRKVIFWGIVGAIVLRAVFIFAGASLLDAFSWMIYVFGAFLVLTAIRMARHSETEIHPDRNPVLRLLRRVMPMTDRFHGERLFIRQAGRWAATPLVGAFLLVATFDAVFAIDSIPAIFAVTRDTFVVASANAMSLLGLTALYFLLADAIGRFRYLSVGLAVVLGYVGVKMLVSGVYHIPVLLSLGVIVLVLGAAIAASLITTRGQAIAAPSEP